MQPGPPIEAPTPWDHPVTAELPHPLDTWVPHARTFSAVMHGAALAYNLMLAELAQQREMGDRYEGLADRYQARLDEWADEMGADSVRLATWDLSEFWHLLTSANPRIPLPTQRFITRWVELVKDEPHRAAALSPEVRHLLEDREVFLKRSQARLKTHRALELWTGQSGTEPLTYRWPTATRMLTDIQEGLTRA